MIKNKILSCLKDSDHVAIMFDHIAIIFDHVFSKDRATGSFTLLLTS